METTLNTWIKRESSASIAESALFDALLRLLSAGLTPSTLSWPAVEELANHVAEVIGARGYRWFDYDVPAKLQDDTPERLRKAYPARLAYTDSAPGSSTGRAVLCLGGIVNSARRFDFLAADMNRAQRIVAVDWPGRGRSAWLAQQSHYTHALLVHAILSLIDGLGLDKVTIIGSSLGGSVAMSVASARPDLVEGIVLNDIGPEMSSARRQRRAETVSRYHHFAMPSDLFRRAGAAAKHDGPIGDAVRLHNIMGQTRRCASGGGREYRHDPRATQAYAVDAGKDIDQWAEFDRLSCPLLLLHGEESDALTAETVMRMQSRRPAGLVVAHVPLTGHTPALADRDSITLIENWMSKKPLSAENRLPERDSPTRLLFDPTGAPSFSGHAAPDRQERRI